MKLQVSLSDSLLLTYVRFEVWLFLVAPSFAWDTWSLIKHVIRYELLKVQQPFYHTPYEQFLQLMHYASILAPYSDLFAIATAVVALVVSCIQASRTPPR